MSNQGYYGGPQAPPQAYGGYNQPHDATTPAPTCAMAPQRRHAVVADLPSVLVCALLEPVHSFEAPVPRTPISLATKHLPLSAFS
ncbi:hypothetical protein M8818_002821 [Zalaria obscura]|uniref:Uncharacterized protein n=1 Tax=Zalaria obscura TaxID=2024903 RepID=A0ACC3SHL1_9PEZI